MEVEYNMKTFRTLCSGGELFGVGARQAGYTHVDGYEIEPKIAATAKLNGFDVRTADVCAVDYAALPAVDHLHASPSCKSASQANVEGRETPEDLAVADAICRAIAAHQGDTFTLENVWQYRAFESFDRIRAALSEASFSYDYWHLNAADYGVPQTRKRLILIARRGLCRISRPHPTHRRGGDMFSPPWVGWYAAIADILHTLPPTKPAPWQEARMPKALRESTLFPSRMSHDQNGNCYGPQSRDAAEPAQTLGTMTPGWYKAILVGDQAGSQGSAPRALLIPNANAGQEWGKGYWEGDEPSPTVAHGKSPYPRAYIVGGGNTQLADIDSYARPDSEPMFTVSASDGIKKTASAYLLDGDNATSSASGEPAYRAADEPAMTVRGSPTPAHRAYAAGRWVRMTIQALGRFQTVPDNYQSLTAEINGNGIPCLFARRIMESLRGVE